ncbi:unnamed protein product [Linum trigynum]|uniref:Gnk2-homologous domain-containing protein n=1 Tax=Linum trigynum TaxID=586398 RepID=A0AAV2E2H0_9ROSI
MSKNRLAVVRLLIVAITSVSVTSTAYVAAARSYDPMCTGPPDGRSLTGGLYYYGCNTQVLPRNSSEAQNHVLSSIQNKLYNMFSTNHSGLCDRQGTSFEDRGRTSSSITLYSYASCRRGDDREGCYECLKGAGQIVRDNCYGTSGVQALSENCCVRYELYSFC